MIEDTSFIIDLLRGEDRALERLRYIESERQPEKVSAITVLELYEGMALSGRPDDQQHRVIEVLDSKHVLPAGHDVMQKAGSISGELYRDGQPIDREDCVVAATAIYEDEPMITRNADHFRRVPGIEVVTY